MILKSETYHFHRLDLTRQAGFVVTVYDEDGLRLAATPPLLFAQLPDCVLGSSVTTTNGTSRGNPCRNGLERHLR